MKTLKFFRIDLVVLALALVIAFLYGSWTALYLTAVLVVVEIVFSFDNAAVNAKYLVRMSPFWQKMFLTVGILIAVFGMRLIFPFLLVSASAGISPVKAVGMAAGGVLSPTAWSRGSPASLVAISNAPSGVQVSA